MRTPTRVVSRRARRVSSRSRGDARSLLTTLVVSLSLVHLVDGAAFVVEKASLQVLDPPSLRGAYDTAIGDFGVPKYGAKLVGEVVRDASNAKACDLFKDPAPKAKGVGHSTIFLVDRGDCFFLEKAWHAQLAGANAVLVVDNVDEDLVTMANPTAGQGGAAAAELESRIDVPSALVQKTLGEALKKTIQENPTLPVIVTLDWSASIANPDAKVEWELWTTSNQVCGAPCDRSMRFVNEMKETAQKLEKSNSTSFTPHFLSWSCADTADPELSCPNMCVNKGRYCAPDPVEGLADSSTVDLVRKHGYTGSDVVEENVRQLCMFKELQDKNDAAGWWTYAARHAAECSMTTGSFDRPCAEGIMRGSVTQDASSGLGFDPDAIQRVRACVGDLAADTSNKVMEIESKLQRDADDSGRGAVVLLPTLVINSNQYRGRLTGKDVLRAICAGFAEGTAPHDVCFSGDLETNECEEPGNAGCWFLRVPPSPGSPDSWKNFSACVDTFRGYQCKCPRGFRGDGVTCEDIDECADEASNECEQVCTNEIGTYECSCRSGYKIVGGFSCVPLAAFDANGRRRGLGVGGALFVTFAVAVVVAAGGFAAYKYVLKRRIDTEVRAIMADYMPLDDREGDDRRGSGFGGTGSGVRDDVKLEEMGHRSVVR